eukprot:PhM_4_TR10593/c0_g1_i1/m.67610
MDNNQNKSSPSVHLGERIASGAQGEVFFDKTRTHIVKVLKAPSFANNRALLEGFYFRMANMATWWGYRQQQQQLAGVQHIVRYFTPRVNFDRTELHAIMEILPGGDALQLLSTLARYRIRLSQKGLVGLLCDVASGLRYLHEVHNIAHLDVKLENIMFRERPATKDRVSFVPRAQCSTSSLQNPNSSRLPSAVLIDLETMLMHTSSSSSCLPTGTGEYMSPEWTSAAASRNNNDALGMAVVGPKCDVYALGIVVLSLGMVSDTPGCFSWVGEDGKKEGGFLSCGVFTPSLLAGVVRHCLAGYSEGLMALVTRMVSHDPSTRPTAAEVQECAEALLLNKSDYFNEFPRAHRPYSLRVIPGVAASATWSGENDTCTLCLSLPCPQCGLSLRGVHHCKYFRHGQHAHLTTSRRFPVSFPREFIGHVGIPPSAVMMAYAYGADVQSTIDSAAVPGVVARQLHDLHLLGGCVFFGARNSDEVLSVHAFSNNVTAAANIFFGAPQPWPSSCTRQLLGRIVPVSSGEAAAAGARHTTWLEPSSEFHLASGAVWRTSEYGARVYFFSEDPTNVADGRDVVFPIGAPPPFPPAAPVFRDPLIDSLCLTMDTKYSSASYVIGRQSSRPQCVLVGDEDAECNMLCHPRMHGLPPVLQQVLPEARGSNSNIWTMYSHPLDRFLDAGAFVTSTSMRSVRAWRLHVGHDVDNVGRVPVHFRPVTVTPQLTPTLEQCTFVDVSVLDWKGKGYLKVGWVPEIPPAGFAGGLAFLKSDHKTYDVYECFENTTTASRLHSSVPSDVDHRRPNERSEWLYCNGDVGWCGFSHENVSAILDAVAAGCESVGVSEPLPGSTVHLMTSHGRLTLTHPALSGPLCVVWM